MAETFGVAALRHQRPGGRRSFFPQRTRGFSDSRFSPCFFLSQSYCGIVGLGHDPKHQPQKRLENWLADKNLTRFKTVTGWIIHTIRQGTLLSLQDVDLSTTCNWSGGSLLVTDSNLQTLVLHSAR